MTLWPSTMIARELEFVHEGLPHDSPEPPAAPAPHFQWQAAAAGLRVRSHTIRPAPRWLLSLLQRAGASPAPPRRST